MMRNLLRTILNGSLLPLEKKPQHDLGSAQLASTLHPWSIVVHVFKTEENTS